MIGLDSVIDLDWVIDLDSVIDLDWVTAPCIVHQAFARPDTVHLAAGPPVTVRPVTVPHVPATCRITVAVIGDGTRIGTGDGITTATTGGDGLPPVP